MFPQALFHDDVQMKPEQYQVQVGIDEVPVRHSSLHSSAGWRSGIAHLELDDLLLQVLAKVFNSVPHGETVKLDQSELVTVAYTTLLAGTAVDGTACRFANDVGDVVVELAYRESKEAEELQVFLVVDRGEEFRLVSP